MQTINSAQIIRVAHPETTVAPFCLARVGGISAARLDNLALHQTAQLLHTSGEAEKIMRLLAPPLEDALYGLVSQTEGRRELCRCVLKVKRHIHNQRAWAEMEEDIKLVSAEFGDKNISAQLLQWQQAAATRQSAREAASGFYAQEATTAAQALASHLQSTELRAGIALASPNTLADVLRADHDAREDWRPASKLARSGLAYLSRAALKTSPFSTLTQLAVATFADEKDPSASEHPAPTSFRGRNAVQVLRALPFSWLQLMARDAELAVTLQYEPNTGIYTREPQKVRVLTTQHEFHEAFATRTERIATRQFDPQQIPALAEFLAANQRLGYYELIDLLEATGRFPKPHEALVQLVEIQFLRPVAPYASGDPQALRKLAAALAPIKSERAAHIAALLLEAQELTPQFQNAEASQRPQLMERLRHLATQIFAAFHAPAPTWLQRASLWYEDVRCAGAPLTLHQRIARDLQAVATIIRPRLIRTHLYDYLYQYFVRRFGADGMTMDILGFLQDFREREDFQEILHRALAEDQRVWKEGDTGTRAHLPGGASAVVPTASIYFQLAAASQEALQRGEYTFVVNEVGSGQGGLVGRFTQILGAEHGRLQERLAAWVQETHGDAPVFETPLMGEWNNLHARLGVTAQALQWPGELPTTETKKADDQGTSHLRDLQLHADDRTQTLYFTDQTGQTVSPAYLGLMPSLRFNGVMGLFLTLIDPWVANPEIGGKKLPMLEEAPVAPVDLEFTPRRTQGHLVLGRARWRFPVTQIPVRGKGESEFDFFARVQQWRAEHELPEEVFATVERQAVEFDARYRKPIWIHLSSPHTLELLRHLIVEGALAVTLTEALPTREQHWVSVATAENELPEKRVSEMIGLVRWSMPEPSVDTRRQPGKIATLRHQASDWLFLKIYPGRYEETDDLIRRVIAPAREIAHATGQLKRWFFLRYHDARGPHLRLRMQGSAAFCEKMSAHLDRLLTQTLPSLSAATRPPIVALDVFPFPTMQGTPGYVRARYEPEYEKYGGEVGVAIAEKLFEVSSELALHTLSLSPQERTALALRVMKWLVCAAHPTATEREHFLTHYFWYWSGQNRPQAEGVRARLAEAVRVQAQSEPAEIPQRARLQEALEEYRLTVKMTVRAWQAAGVAVPLTRLCFDYAHVTNNRLGLSGIEEAYLASLLRAAG